MDEIMMQDEVKIIAEASPRIVYMYDMKPGQYGIIEPNENCAGDIVKKITDDIVVTVGGSPDEYWDNCNPTHNLPCPLLVRILSPGTKLEITIGEIDEG
jgi:hypothetical protein